MAFSPNMISAWHSAGAQDFSKHFPNLLVRIVWVQSGGQQAAFYFQGTNYSVNSSGISC